MKNILFDVFWMPFASANFIWSNGKLGLSFAIEIQFKRLKEKKRNWRKFLHFFLFSSLDFNLSQKEKRIETKCGVCVPVSCELAFVNGNKFSLMGISLTPRRGENAHRLFPWCERHTHSGRTYSIYEFYAAEQMRTSPHPHCRIILQQFFIMAENGELAIKNQ